MEARGWRNHWITGWERFAAMHPRTGDIYYLSGHRLVFTTFERQANGQPYKLVDDNALEPWEALAPVHQPIIPWRERVLPDMAHLFPRRGRIHPCCMFYSQSVFWRDNVTRIQTASVEVADGAVSVPPTV